MIGMGLNTATKIKDTLMDGIAALSQLRSKNASYPGGHTHQLTATPEYKLNFGIRVLNTHTFSCTAVDL